MTIDYMTILERVITKKGLRFLVRKKMHTPPTENPGYAYVPRRVLESFHAGSVVCARTGDQTQNIQTQKKNNKPKRESKPTNCPEIRLFFETTELRVERNRVHR